MHPPSCVWCVRSPVFCIILRKGYVHLVRKLEIGYTYVHTCFYLRLHIMSLMRGSFQLSVCYATAFLVWPFGQGRRNLWFWISPWPVIKLHIRRRRRFSSLLSFQRDPAWKKLNHRIFSFNSLFVWSSITQKVFIKMKFTAVASALFLASASAFAPPAFVNNKNVVKSSSKMQMS